MDDRTPSSDAGRDADIAARLERDPENREARLDSALDQSMDASDPPSGTQPVHNHGPAPSSNPARGAQRSQQRNAEEGGDAGSHAEEAERQQDA